VLKNFYYGGELVFDVFWKNTFFTGFFNLNEKKISANKNSLMNLSNLSLKELGKSLKSENLSQKGKNLGIENINLQNIFGASQVSVLG
jgi:hypothetical protein